MTAPLGQVDGSAAHLVKLLEKLDMRDTDLSELVEVDRATVWRWTTGKTDTPASVVRLLELMWALRKLTLRAKVFWNMPSDLEDAP